jgi:ferredoxin
MDRFAHGDAAWLPGDPIVTVAISALCTACGACLATCPEHALLMAPGRPLVLDLRCTDCLACVEVCPTDAISLQPMGPRDGARRPGPL